LKNLFSWKNAGGAVPVKEKLSLHPQNRMGSFTKKNREQGERKEEVCSPGIAQDKQGRILIIRKGIKRGDVREEGIKDC